MYKYLVVLLFFCTVQAQEKPSILWGEHYKLVWADFKKVSNPTLDKNAAAVTSSGITFSFSSKKTAIKLVDFNYKVVADFYPNESWYLKGKETDIILAHERLHFDITELFARQLRQRIEMFEFTKNINQEMKRIHRKIIKELNVYQERYDLETNHSLNLEIQLQWQNKVASKLKALNAYKY